MQNRCTSLAEDNKQNSLRIRTTLSKKKKKKRLIQYMDLSKTTPTSSSLVILISHDRDGFFSFLFFWKYNSPAPLIKLPPICLYKNVKGRLYWGDPYRYNTHCTYGQPGNSYKGLAYLLFLKRLSPKLNWKHWSSHWLTTDSMSSG